MLYNWTLKKSNGVILAPIDDETEALIVYNGHGDVVSEPIYNADGECILPGVVKLKAITIPVGALDCSPTDPQYNIIGFLGGTPKTLDQLYGTAKAGMVTLNLDSAGSGKTYPANGSPACSKFFGGLKPIKGSSSEQQECTATAGCKS